ncbi:PPE domain-containing protein, partial [Prauserella halophila]
MIANCMPLPWPPREPEGPQPGKDALESEFDWQVLPHAELHRMATTGVDADTAEQVSDKWAELGAQLQDIGDSLRAALREASEGWQGGGVEQARRRVEQLSTWTDRTARDSHGVAAAIQAQSHLAQWAKNNMPEPPQATLPWPWRPPLMLMPAGEAASPGHDVVALGGSHPDGVRGSSLPGEIDVLGDGVSGAAGGTGGGVADAPGDGGWALGRGTTDPGARTGGTSGGSGAAGTGGGFAEGAALPQDPFVDAERREELHRQAAQVMRTYQLESGTVFRGVPQFVMPGEDIVKDDPRDEEKSPPPDRGTDPAHTG